MQRIFTVESVLIWGIVRGVGADHACRLYTGAPACVRRSSRTCRYAYHYGHNLAAHHNLAHYHANGASHICCHRRAHCATAAADRHAHHHARANGDAFSTNQSGRRYGGANRQAVRGDHHR